MHIQPCLEGESLITGIRLLRVDKDIKEKRLKSLSRKQKSEQGNHP